MAFGDYQIEIYLQGLAGNVPSLPMAFADWETRARSAPPPSVYASGWRSAASTAIPPSSTYTDAVASVK